VAEDVDSRQQLDGISKPPLISARPSAPSQTTGALLEAPESSIVKRSGVVTVWVPAPSRTTTGVSGARDRIARTNA
jgi:hypothetical protein